MLRIAAVYAQAATIVITWPVWQVRHYSATANFPETPNLPAFPLPQIDMGWLLLCSLVVVLFYPRRGVILHGALLLVAILLDQMRMQPECISLWVLMLGSLDSAGPRFLRTVI